MYAGAQLPIWFPGWVVQPSMKVKDLYMTNNSYKCKSNPFLRVLEHAHLHELETMLTWLLHTPNHSVYPTKAFPKKTRPTF